MLCRFASATAVASVVIALAAFTMMLPPTLGPEKVYRLTTAWCIVPAVWGLWAMVAPRTWVPERLPIWGGILGLIAGLMALFVVKIPAQILGTQLSAPQQGLVMVFAIAFYYLLWMVVRKVWRSLGGSLPPRA